MMTLPYADLNNAPLDTQDLTVRITTAHCRNLKPVISRISSATHKTGALQ